MVLGPNEEENTYFAVCSSFAHLGSTKRGKEVVFMEWTTPDFEEIETSCEVTAYVAHW